MDDPIAAAVVAELEELGVDFELLDCDPDLADTATFCAHYGYPLDRSANTILVASRKPEGVLALCVVLADSRLDVNNRVRRLMGVRKVSFAPAGLTKEATGMLIGGVTPFGVPDGLPIWIDRTVMDKEWVILGGGSRSYKIRVSPEVFTLMANAEVIDELAQPSEP